MAREICCMVNALVFDLDGTLIDTMADIAAAMNRTLEAFALSPQPLSVYQKLIGGGSRNMVENLVPEGMDKQQVFEHYLADYKQNLQVATQAYPGVHEALRHFQQAGIKLAVVTNKYHQQAQALLKSLFADIRFDAVQGVTDELPKKPHPQMVYSALAQMDSQAGECLYIGDTATDIKTAQAAGIPVVYVHWGYGGGKVPEQADNASDFSIKDISQLLELVQTKNNNKEKGKEMTLTSEAAVAAGTSAVAEKLIPVIQSYLLADEQDKFVEQGASLLLSQLNYFIEKNRPLEFILPGFPCKSPNVNDKTFSALPDYGEVRAIERLDEFCGKLNELYPAGCQLTILSDGTTFSDIVCVPEETKEAYKQTLRNVTVTENIQSADLTSLVETKPGK